MNDIDATLVEIPRGTDILSDAAQNMWSNMKWRALFCLCDKHGDLKVTKLAELVGMSSHETITALESLEALGMIEKTSKGYAQTRKNIKRTPTEATRRAVFSDFALSTDQAVTRLLETPDSPRHLTRSTVYNASYASIERFTEKYNQAVKELIEEIKETKDSWDGVFAINLAVVDVTGEVR